MPIILYQAPQSTPCWAVVMTADHLDIKLDIRDVDLFADDQTKREYLKMNPQRCVPTIDDDGFYLWESRAIQTYLVNKYAPNSPLYPSDPKERAVVDRMLYFDIGTLFKSLADCVYAVIAGGRDQEKDESLKKVFALFEKILEKTPYSAGKHLTVADYAIFVNFVSAEEFFDLHFDEYPKISAWFQRMKEETPRYKELQKFPFKQYLEKLKQKASV